MELAQDDTVTDFAAKVMTFELIPQELSYPHKI